MNWTAGDDNNDDNDGDLKREFGGTNSRLIRIQRFTMGIMASPLRRPPLSWHLRWTLLAVLVLVLLRTPALQDLMGKRARDSTFMISNA